MKDGAIGILGTGGTIMLQEVSLWLSIVCASLTIAHFVMLFYSKYQNRNSNGEKKKERFLERKGEISKKEEKIS